MRNKEILSKKQFPGLISSSNDNIQGSISDLNNNQINLYNQYKENASKTSFSIDNLKNKLNDIRSKHQKLKKIN